MVSSALQPQLILASSSPRRVDLLQSLHIIPDQIIAPDINEAALKKEKPTDYARRMAQEKMAAILAHHHKGHIIITADTVVSKGRRILPKAETQDDFNYCMTLLSGGQHTTMTAIAIARPDGTVKTELVQTKLKVKKLHPSEIDQFYQTNEWQGKAGGYALQGYFGQFIKFIGGSYSAVIGLPVYETRKLLDWAGFKRHDRNES